MAENKKSWKDSIIIASEEWSKMSEGERAPFEKMHDKDVLRHEK